MTKEQEESLEKLKRQILIEECGKNIGIPVFISDLKNILSMLKEKDKIIDLMAREIDTLYSGCEPCTLSFNIACKHIKCEQCIKKYFERKVEEDK